jgi:hypothetical protein
LELLLAAISKMKTKGYIMKREFFLRVKKSELIRSSLLLCLFLTFLYCPSSQAVELSTFAGGEIDNHGQSFSYLGVDVTQSLNKTIAVSGRIVPSFLTYKYYSGDNEIKANSPGVSAVAGIKFFWGETMLGIFGGGEFRDTTLSPDDPAASVRGSTTAGVIQGEFYSWLPSRTNLNLFVSYSGTSNFSYERGGIKQQITNLDFKGPYNINVGLEQFYGRNSDFHGEGIGIVVELFYIPQKFSVALRGGFKHDSTFGAGAYGGLDLYKGF